MITSSYLRWLLLSGSRDAPGCCSIWAQACTCHFKGYEMQPNVRTRSRGTQVVNRFGVPGWHSP